MAKFLMITFNYAAVPGAQQKVQETVEGAMDWYRYAPYAWIVWSNRSAEDWCGLIQPKIGDPITFFVCELNIQDRQGWMPLDFWTWVEKPR